MKSVYRRFFTHLLTTLLLAGIGTHVRTEEFEFDVSQFEKKSFQWGGYVALRTEYFNLRQDSALYQINFSGLADRNNLSRHTETLQLTGNYKKDRFGFNFTLHGEAQDDELNSRHDTKVYEGVASFQPNAGMTLEVGKKALKWGKGYAWSPVGFVERSKDPNDPDLSREGFVLATADIIRSGRNVPLQTIAFTPLVLPVSSGVNEDFGAPGHTNLAAKLYLLYRDTDIDFMVLSNGSRSARYGVDFSRNLSTNFEIHGEWAHITKVRKPLTDSSGNTSTVSGSANNYLLGLRYLTENETTWIAEYYRNGGGYTRGQLESFYQLVHNATASDDTALLQQASSLGQQGFLSRNPGRNYLYVRVSNKEPFDILYLTPSITAIVNLDDHSYSLTPEILYTRIQNLELRVRATLLHGDLRTEFGEKQNDSRLELRLRYYF